MEGYLSFCVGPTYKKHLPEYKKHPEERSEMRFARTSSWLRWRASFAQLDLMLCIDDQRREGRYPHRKSHNSVDTNNGRLVRGPATAVSFCKEDRVRRQRRMRFLGLRSEM